MARPKKVDPKISGRDRTRDVNSFALEPLDVLPEPDRKFDKYGTEFYYNIGNELIGARKLRIVDMPSLISAAGFYSYCQRAMDELDKPDGLVQRSQNGYLQSSPYVAVHEKYSKLLQQFADRYGLNLTSVSKIPKAKSDKNKLSEMFE